MTEKQMRDLRLYECNRKQCGDKCSHDISGCHLTSDVRFAVNPEQSVGWDYFVGECLDEAWEKLRKMYLDAIVQSDCYPIYGASAVNFIEEWLTKQVPEVIGEYLKRLEFAPRGLEDKHKEETP